MINHESPNTDPKAIPLSVPSIIGNEWKYVKECLDTEWVSSAGKYVDLFENKIAEYTGASHAIACVNGTSALHVSLRLVGVQPGDEVIVPTLTFIAPINAVTYNGASPIFMDADEYYNLDIEKTIDFIKKETKLSNSKSQMTDHESPITINKKTGKRIAAVVPVHVFGNAVWLDDLISLCAERNIPIVEDASESLGSVYNTGKYADCHTGTIGKFGCLSFNGNKIITTGGGGIILTNDSILAERTKYLITQAKDDPIYYIHDEIGYNFRLTNIQAALGLAQLENLPKFLQKKREIFYQYKTSLEKMDCFAIASVPSYADNNHWLNVLRIQHNGYSEDIASLMERVAKSGIGTRPVWYLNHLQRPFKDYYSYKIENATKLINNSLCIPSSSNLSTLEQQKVINSLNQS